MFNILYQDSYIFPMYVQYNYLDYRTIGLLLYLMFSINTLQRNVYYNLSRFLHIPCVQYMYLDYRTIGLLLYWMFSIDSLTHVQPFAVGLLDYCSI